MSDEHPWIGHEFIAPEYEDVLIGNRAGLTALRDAIQQALQNGAADIPDDGIEYQGVRIVEKPQQTTGASPSRRIVERMISTGCLLVIAALLVSFIFGLIALPGLFRRLFQ